MLSLEPVSVPDLGGAEDVEVIEIAVAEGDRVDAEQTLLTLESDKASMELPSPAAGVVRALRVKVGDRVRAGDLVLELETAARESAAATEDAGAAAVDTPGAEPAAVESAAPESAASTPELPSEAADAARIELVLPDLGSDDSVEVIEVTVAPGEVVGEGMPLLVVEGDKASMEIPAPADGTVLGIEVKVGDRLRSGARFGALGVSSATREPARAAASDAAEAPAAAHAVGTAASGAASGDAIEGITRVLEKEQRFAAAGAGRREPSSGARIYAGPAVRTLARELGVPLAEVGGSGPKRRILKEDVQSFVKSRLSSPAPTPGAALPPLPEVDFAAYGEVETIALNAIQKATVTNMRRSWLNVPHVTQFDQADVSELEAFREGLKPEMERRDNKLTPLPFLLMAAARALREHPRLNASLHPDGAHLVMKKYVHIGIAVDTPQGLVVPVIRDAARKSLWELAAEARELAGRARERKLRMKDMEGGCFTVSSLGNIGGEGFTPIVNAPEVAILGVSRLAVRPVWDGKEFLPRKTLPLSLSYDHRVINGADAGKFLSYLVGLLQDIRRLLL